MDLLLTPPAELNFDMCPSLGLRLSVIVPAKNEELLITSTLEALRLQTDDAGRPIDPNIYEILVLANNCTDNTYQLCLEYKNKYPNFRIAVKSIDIPQAFAHIGTVRRLLMDAACKRLLDTAGHRGIIVSTDADSEVDSTWIFHILMEMDKGVDVVGGRILPRNTPKLSRLHHLRDVKYRFLTSRLESELDPCRNNPWPRHFQCYGPSLAVTCELYERAGRLPVIPFLEDEEFRKALKRVDARIRHSPKVKIFTSSRFDGRVDFGFSVQLKQWSDMTLTRQEQMVESLESVSMKIRIKVCLRQAYKALLSGRPIDMGTIAEHINMCHSELIELMKQNVYFESFWEKVEGHVAIYCPELNSVRPISQAISEFHSYFAARPRPQQHHQFSTVLNSSTL